MRKITKEICEAFLRKEQKAKSNTLSTGSSLYLHGNEIARWVGDTMNITLAGWNTTTTRERLNGLGVRVTTKKGQAYLNGEKWDGRWVAIVF